MLTGGICLLPDSVRYRAMSWSTLPGVDHGILTVSKF